MLTGKMVRVRYARDRVVPYFIDPGDESWRLAAENLLDLYRAQIGQTRGELDQDLTDMIGDDPTTLVHQGLAKLLEDRCEFEVVAGHPPEQLRTAVFQTAALVRQSDDPIDSVGFDRAAVLARVAQRLDLPAEQVERGMFADLKSEQRLITFEDISAPHLLDRYNVALAQSVLLRAVRVSVTIRNESPQRYRQLLRQVKFHRLLCDLDRLGPDSWTIHLDGPLSLFSATQKYGLQLALFLPSILLCKDFELKAELRWGTQRKTKQFVLVPRDRLVSHAPDHGMYTPPELQVFIDSFRKRITEWTLAEEPEVFPLGNGFWVPDFRLEHRATGKVVLLEVLGFWRKSSAVKHLQYLQRYATRPFILAVSDQLHIDETLEDMPAGIHRFRHIPLADEVARLAAEAVGV